MKEIGMWADGGGEGCISWRKWSVRGVERRLFWRRTSRNYITCITRQGRNGMLREAVSLNVVYFTGTVFRARNKPRTWQGDGEDAGAEAE